jgi:flavin-dependent dehydrogenase
MTLAEDSCDILVIGGGPAGSTAAALLAERGADVVLLEKEAHPRFHIGESLLPRNLQILDRLGLRAQVDAIGVYKPGAEFISDATGQSVAFPFALSSMGGADHAYQVRRAEFDALLFATARGRGARAVEQTCVTDVTDAGERLLVTAQAPDGPRRFAARFVLDASGRDGVMASRHALRHSDRRNGTAAVFAHYRNVALRAETQGYISIHLTDDGWFWVIPLRDGITSVGFVGNQAAFKRRHGRLDAFLAERLRDSPTMTGRMKHAELVGEVRGAANYSYRASRAWGDRWMMIGDAFAFVDPVFSSGVLLAMSAAERGAATALAWLEDPRRGMALARQSERECRAAMDRFNWLIYRINTPELRSMFMAPRNDLGMRDGLISLLSGHLGEGARAQMPVLAFKAAYYGLCGLRRLGVRRIVPDAAKREIATA